MGAGHQQVRKIVELAHLRGGQISVRDTMRAGPCISTSDEARKVIGQAIERGLGCWEEPEPGCPPTVFKLLTTDSTDTTLVSSPSEGGVSVVSVSVGGVI